MICPFCKWEKVKILRTEKFETCVLRIRYCESCRKPFKTYEIIHLDTPIKPIFITQNGK